MLSWTLWSWFLPCLSFLSVYFSFLASESGRTGGNSSDLLTLPSKKDASAPANIYFEKQAVAESNLYVTVACPGEEEKESLQEKESPKEKDKESTSQEEDNLDKGDSLEEKLQKELD